MGIAWTLLGTGLKEPRSYYQAFDRLKEIHLQTSPEDRVKQTRTQTGKKLMKEKIQRETKFIEDFSEELGINIIGNKE